MDVKGDREGDVKGAEEGDVKGERKEDVKGPGEEDVKGEKYTTQRRKTWCMEQTKDVHHTKPDSGVRQKEMKVTVFSRGWKV